MQRLGLVLALALALLNAACGSPERTSTLATSDGSDKPLVGKAGELCAQRPLRNPESCANSNYECTALVSVGPFAGPVKARSACSFAEARARLLEEICEDESLEALTVKVEDLSCVTTPLPT